MSLVKLQLSDFRNIQQASLALSPGLNILVGCNGSGKTSVLEAIHYLGLGRSFRTHLTGRVIRQGRGRLPCLPSANWMGVRCL